MRGVMRGLFLGAVLGLAAGPAAQAQQQPPQQAVSADLIRLHDSLHLTALQEMAWRDYTRAIAPDPQAQARRQAAEQLMPMVPAPRRIALMEAAMESDLADFRREGAAVTAFYNLLTPDQQRTFDRETLPVADGRAGARGP
jgi:hypothetical protein